MVTLQDFIHRASHQEDLSKITEVSFFPLSQIVLAFSEGHLCKLIEVGLFGLLS